MRHSLNRRWFMVPLAAALSLVGGLRPWAPLAQAQDTITLRSDIQEANTSTGVITARGNVQIDYPSQQIWATSAQADYYSNEQRIVLSGNVLVTQQGNTLRAEVVTYLIDEGRFVAAPRPREQVETIYQIPASQAPAMAVPAPTPPRVSPTPPAAVLEVSPVDQSDNREPTAPAQPSTPGNSDNSGSEPLRP